MVAVVFIGGVFVLRKYQQSQDASKAPPGTGTSGSSGCGGAHSRSDYDKCYCTGGQMFCSRNGSSCTMSACSDTDLNCCDTETGVTTPAAASLARSFYAGNQPRETILYEYPGEPINTRKHLKTLESINKFKQDPSVSISVTDTPQDDINNDLYYDNFESYEYMPTVELPMRVNVFYGATMKALTGMTSAELSDFGSNTVGDNKLNTLWFGRTHRNSIYRNMQPIVG